MSSGGFFDFREKLISERRPAPVVIAQADAGKAITVSAVTKLVESAIRTGVPGGLLVRGEVSNFNFNRASGHAYFSLKDSTSILNCVMFKGDYSRIKFQPGDGMELLASGSVKVYAPSGRYQLYVNSLTPLREGALELAFQQMRAKLEAEGLFRPERKKPIPTYPAKIVLITSREGAALQDMLKILRRFAWVRLMLLHVPVQGDNCGAAIAGAVNFVNRTIDQVGGADLILLGRGGGSLEDLCGFNDESLARAIANSKLPIITGIGHEVDVSIADLVADHWAHTPTEAATRAMLGWQSASDILLGGTQRLRRSIRMLLSDRKAQLDSILRHEIFRRPTDRINDLRMRLDDRQQGLLIGVNDLLRQKQRRLVELQQRLERVGPTATVGKFRNRVASLAERLGQHHPKVLIRLKRAELSALQGRLIRAMRTTVKADVGLIDSLNGRLQALNPEGVLKRGYSLTRVKKTGAIVRNASQLKVGEKIVTRFSDGEVESIVEDSKQMGLFE